MEVLLCHLLDLERKCRSVKAAEVDGPLARLDVPLNQLPTSDGLEHFLRSELDCIHEDQR